MGKHCNIMLIYSRIILNMIIRKAGAHTQMMAIVRKRQEPTTDLKQNSSERRTNCPHKQTDQFPTKHQEWYEVKKQISDTKFDIWLFSRILKKNNNNNKGSNGQERKYEKQLYNSSLL